MSEIVNSVLWDHDMHDPKQVILGIGLYKDVFEEYLPLCNLALYLHACSAHLTPKSNEGPDGVIQLVTGEEMLVQITVADESYQEALVKEKISQGHITFLMSRKHRDSRTGKVIEEGHGFTQPEGYLRLRVKQVVEAIRRKLSNYYEGTDALLISVSVLRLMERLTATYDWRQDLRDRVREIECISYRKLYVANNEEIIDLIGYKARQ